jgi:soluble lytic murein transglycosylase-like protein
LLTALRQGNTDIKVGLMQVAVLASDAARLNDVLEPAINLREGLRQQPAGAENLIPALRQRYQRLGLTGFCQRGLSLRHARSAAKFKRQGKVNPHLAALVHEIARPYQVDPALVMAVIQQESGFNTAALSSKKAQGLMQLMPQTALRFGVRHPFEAKDNIRGGIAYLHWLLRHFNGNVALVLAGYNAGEHAVERYQGIPPYAETQHYVRAIMAHYPSTHHPIPPPVSS